MASTGEAWRLGRRPALDGLRGLAILLVLADHLDVPGFATTPGIVGVTVFFTLSGFLITSLLIQEEHQVGRISLPRFYARRALRLLPAIVVCVLVVTSVGALVGGRGGLEAAAAALFYVANWAKISGLDLGPLAHTWSLSIEEQFYFVWPLVLIAVCRHRWLAVTVAAGLAAASVWWQWQLVEDHVSFDRIRYATEVNGYALLVGCLLALGLSSVRAQRPLPAMGWLGGVALVAVSSTSVFLLRDLFLLNLITPVLTAATIYAFTCGPASQAEAVAGRPNALGWLGRRSYGLYMWHWPLVVAATSLFGAFDWGERFMVLAASLAATELSWRYVERPFLERKPRYASGVAPMLLAMDVAMGRGRRP